MEKISINPNRLNWCLEEANTSMDSFLSEINFAKSTIEKAMQKQAVLTIGQLEKIAKYFDKSLLFFIEHNDVVEEKIHSLQFRTISNQYPIHSKKLRKFIKNVENQRKVYLNLLNDLTTPASQQWQELELDVNNIKRSCSETREWLGLKENYKFDDLRNAVEDKGVMVIVSNGYNGSWQIDKKDSVRGLSLCYEILPIIAIKKQSEGAQAFTLMHELAHLLLHKESAIDDEESFYSYQGKEKQANEFASAVLMPDDFLATINLEELRLLEIQEYDNYLNKFKKEWCVSGDAILYRLLNENNLSQNSYNEYRNFKIQQIRNTEQEEERKKELGIDPPIIPRSYRHREPIKMFGKNYVATVLNAKENKHITLFKASTYLDNLKIHTLHKLESEIV